MLQGGILLSIFGYMAYLQPSMALVALGVFAPQLVFVPIMQSAINRRVAKRIAALRDDRALVSPWSRPGKYPSRTRCSSSRRASRARQLSATPPCARQRPLRPRASPAPDQPRRFVRHRAQSRGQADRGPSRDQSVCASSEILVSSRLFRRRRPGMEAGISRKAERLSRNDPWRCQ